MVVDTNIIIRHFSAAYKSKSLLQRLSKIRRFNLQSKFLQIFPLVHKNYFIPISPVLSKYPIFTQDFIRLFF